MKFGILTNLQVPRPWEEGTEERLFNEALDQVELADALGFDYAWQTEHHFLEEFSHSSAPELFLAACSQRTKRIRLGHGIVLMPPGYNHPGRVAERISSLDVLSGGRVDFGVGESVSATELEGYGIDIATKKEQFLECTEQCANMMAMDPYPGYEGKSFSMPCRNFVPKPVQKPHPPLWMACSNRDSIKYAARLGMGALTFAFVDAEEAKKWVDDYYRVLKEECQPIGHAINPNVCMATGLSIHQDREVAVQRAADALPFFGFGLAHYYAQGVHTPGRTNLWKGFETIRDTMPAQATGGVGTPEDLRAQMQDFADAGVDQVAFIHQGGKARHEHICEGLHLLAEEVLPAFQEGEEEREARKLEQLAPYIEAAMRRKVRMTELADAEIPVIEALGRRIVDSASKI